jgi:DNA-binding response OmpR family regulator
MPQPTILFVDDEELLRDLLRRSLQKEGYSIVTASHSEEALALFATTPIDLVLADVLMPGMDGFTLCRELRKQSKVPIILVTRLNQPDDIAYAFSIGADDCITKPFQLRDVVAHIQILLRRT